MILEISDEKSIFLETGIIVGSNYMLTLIVYLVFLNCIADKYENVDIEDKNDEENPVLSDTEISSEVLAVLAEKIKVREAELEKIKSDELAAKINFRKAQDRAANEAAMEETDNYGRRRARAELALVGSA